MTVIKVKSIQNNFTIVPNEMINDKLSWAARGMLLYLCSKPDDWEVCLQDLINQTKGCQKGSGRDQTRKIMDELIHCGYMRKTQKRLSGRFERNDYEVSFVPFTENPFTVNPTQQSTELNKVKKELIQTPLQASEVKFLIGELDENEFRHCNDIIDAMESYDCFFTGKLKLSEWKYCELQMSSVGFMDHTGYVDWFVGNKIKSFRKKPSLPNLLTDLGGMTFKEYHDKMMR